jgi:hypothetical protein
MTEVLCISDSPVVRPLPCYDDAAQKPQSQAATPAVAHAAMLYCILGSVVDLFWGHASAGEISREI